MYGKCMWIGCNVDAIYETLLDYPKIFVCEKHYHEHRRLARKQKNRMVSHPSFTQRQRNNNLKVQFR